MASAASRSDKKIAAKRPIPKAEESSAEVSAMLLPSLYRLTEGLPRKELKLMVSEAMICEEALENEIRQLKEALENPYNSCWSPNLPHRTAISQFRPCLDGFGTI
jgi:hypothetical protein